MQAIQAQSLSKTYRSGRFRKEEVRALVDFSISVEPGQIFSLLGPNGAGKTTFIKILLSLVNPTGGDASILGEQLPSTDVRRKIGYLPESHRYPGYLTGDQVLRFFGELGKVPRETINSRIGPLMELVGMTKWRGMRVKKYSKGMMQRLGLAQALINEPEILFLDEPTDGVDPIGRKEIREILKDLRNRGKTIFLNSHMLSEVELISDRVAVLDKGQLLKQGTVDELTSGGFAYAIGIAGSLPPDVIDEARAVLLNFTLERDSVIAECKTTEELNRLIDLLRKNRVDITSVVRQRSTLEDSFLSLIKRAEGV
ncbi:MAG TPA: ABC transporter ATP-binding protein [Bacteroidota bacterium]|nr:ABC transporter ATP-binding protein [Bacteroidota bacterium]